MTDFELTKLCADAMGLEVTEGQDIAGRKFWYLSALSVNYDPLHDGAQALDLVKKFEINIDSPTEPPYAHWYVESLALQGSAFNIDLNRAIVECSAKINRSS